MKRKFYYLFLSGILFLSISAFGQKTVIVVQPDEGLNIGALNDAITSAVDPGNSIFELKRGGLYLLDGAINHTGYTLHIRAEAGTGPRPVLQPAVDQLGASQNHFNPGAKGNLILEGLFIEGRDELGAIANRQIIVNGDSLTIIINDCYLDYSNQSWVRLTTVNNKVFVNNSILRNAIRPENPDNGRPIDARHTPQDTLSIENSTLYNFSNHIFIWVDGGIKCINFNHNTVYQSNILGGFDLGTTLKVNATNNIFYNFAYRANNTTHNALFVVDSMFNFEEKTDADRYFDLSNNNWYQLKEFGDILDEYGNDTLYRFNSWDVERLDTIWYRYVTRTDLFWNQAILDTAVQTLPPRILHFIEAGQVDTSNIFSEPLVFNNPPPLHLDYWKFYVENNYSIGALDPPNPFADEDPYDIGEAATGAYTFNYNDNSRSATAADGGLPLGDPRWVPYSTVSTGKIDAVNSTNVRTYPNPCSGAVNFEINAKEASSVRIIVYDLIGKEIFSLSEKVSQGVNIIPVNLNSISRSGIYLYQVQSELSTGQKNIASGKIVKR